MKVDFGFYPLQFDADYGDVHIETRDDFESSVKAVKSEPSVGGDWIYSPHKELHALGSNSIRVLPYPTRVFGLPKTHTLSHRMDDPVRLHFLVWCFGFFVGMRMSDQQAGFLDATPIKPGVSNDIVWFGDSVIAALGAADEFFTANANAPKVELALRAAIHSYLASDIPTLLDYERFIHLYTAVDACYAASGFIAGKPKKNVRHAERIAYLCDEIGLPVPWWADRNSAFVAKQRNETLHEGLFFGEPWGILDFWRESTQRPKTANAVARDAKTDLQDRDRPTWNSESRIPHILRVRSPAAWSPPEVAVRQQLGSCFRFAVIQEFLRSIHTSRLIGSLNSLAAVISNT